MIINSESDFMKMCWEGLKEMTTKLTVYVGWVMRLTFTYRILWMNKTSNIGEIQTLVYFIKLFFTFKKLQYGAQFPKTE